MSNTVIRVENLSKHYRLGAIGSNTLRDDVSRWVANLRGQPDPTLKIGQTASRNSQLATRNSPTDDLWALKDVSFEVKQGEVVGIIGRNGAGKSTLLKILSRITAPTSGQVKVKGRIASLLEVGTGFHPELTGRENIYLNGAILGMKRAEIARKFDEIVDFSGVEQFIDTPVKRYSSGMYVRLAFAVAAHLEPEILLVDEVLAVGDAAFQKKCLGKMGEVAKEGRTVLFVSHNMAAVSNLCERCLYIDNGKAVRSGSTSDVIKQYLKLSATLTNQQLITRIDRKGNGKVLLTSCDLLDPVTGEELNSVVSGQDVVFRIRYKATVTDSIQLNSVTAGIKINTSTKTFVTALNPHVLGVHFDNLPYEGSLYCFVPKVPLMSGTYIVDLVLNQVEILDSIEDAFSFDVEPGDYYGSGKENSQGRQGVFLQQRWFSDATKLIGLDQNVQKT